VRTVNAAGSGTILFAAINDVGFPVERVLVGIEAAAAAGELARWLELMAKLDSHPRTNADTLYLAWSEADEIVEKLKGYLAFAQVTA
jgi:hypothetical protein